MKTKTKGKKLSTQITLSVSLTFILCIILLFFVARTNIANAMQQTAQNNMGTSLESKQTIIENFTVDSESLLISFSKADVIKDLLKDPNNPQLQKGAQEYTVKFFNGLDQWEGIYLSDWNTKVMTHSNKEAIGMVLRKDDSLTKLRDSITQAGVIYNTGIIVSPASKQLVLSMYCPIYDDDGKTILGFVGGGPFCERLKNMLNALTVNGLDNAKYYMINTATKKHIFNDDASLIAADISDDMLLSVVDRISINPENTNNTIDFIDDNNNSCIAMYKPITGRNWAIVLTDTQDEIYSTATSSMRIFGIICVLCCIIMSVLTYFVVKANTKPLKIIENNIIRLQNLDLSSSKDLDKCMKSKNEIASIANAIDALAATFRNIVSTLKQSSKLLSGSSDTMDSASKILMECVDDNAATTEELAASISTTNSAIDDVCYKIKELINLVDQVEGKVQSACNQSENLINSSDSMKKIADTALSSSDIKVNENKKNIEEAMVNLQSLTSINDMVTQILDITTQTNLLSLNASIEAARAGESGKGFAVVANEIGNLAKSSSDTATQIQNICNQTNTNIQDIRKCFNEIISFMENDVAEQYKKFADTANDTNYSVASIRSMIESIDNISKTFSESINEIQGQIDIVHSASAENQVGVDSIVQKNERTNITTESITDVVKKNQENTNLINDIVKKFQE